MKLKVAVMKVLVHFLVLIILWHGIFCAPMESENSSSVRKSAQACKSFGTPPMKTSLRIVGGSLADFDEFPHFAAIVKRDERHGPIVFRCAGTLISENFVLTAAHCKAEMCRNFTECIVRMGTNNLADNSKDYSGVDFNIKVRSIIANTSD